MKHYFTLLWFFLMAGGAFSQNKTAYFKTVPADLSGQPEWVHLLYSADPLVGEVEFKYHQYYQNHPFEKNIHTQNYKHWLMQVSDKVNAEGRIRDDASGLDKLALRRVSKKTENSQPVWSLVGPVQTFNFQDQGGHGVSWQANVYCFDQCAANPMIAYAGIEGGGLYKTTDKGMTWFMVSGEAPMSTVDDVKVAATDPDLVYFTSSEKIFKSADGGVNWQIVYETGARGLQLYIHPSRSEIVFCAAENGLFRTDDSGGSWSRILTETCWDVTGKPGHPETIYVLQHDPAGRRCLFLKSNDTGENFAVRETGWYEPEDLSVASDIGGKIGVTPADPDRVYAALIGQSKAGDNGWIGVFRSYDSGESWENPDPPAGGPFDPVHHPNLATINPNGTGFHQGFFNFALGVSHQDPDLLWVGTLSLNRSRDAGASWVRIGAYNAQQDIGWIHPDIQDLHVLGSDVWVCSDGGINYSKNELLTHQSRNLGLAGSNLWGFGQGWNEDVMVGGRYHNGNFGYYEAYPAGHTLRLGGAEAPTGYVNPQFNRRVYFSDISTNWLPDRLDGPATQLSRLSRYPNEAYTESHSSEMEWDLRYSDHMYIGSGGSLYKSTNGGGFFSLLYSFGPNARVLEIEVSRSNPDVLYVVSQPSGGYWDACYIYRSADGGQTFKRTTSVPSSSRWRTEITLNPEDENELWVMSITGSNNRKVYRTLDGGESWENMSGDLLDDHRPQDIQFQAGSGGLVYLATLAGVFYFDPETGSWLDYSEGLPAHTRALEMRLFYAGNKVRLATGGHAIWEAPLAAPFKPLAQPMTRTDTVYRASDTVFFDSYSVIDSVGAQYVWSFDPQPEWISSDRVRNPLVVFGKEGHFDVTLEVTDQHGHSHVRQVESMVTVSDFSGVDGLAGDAFAAYAAGDYMVTESLGLEGDEITMMAWIKPDGIQPDYAGILINNGETAGMNFRGGNNTLGYHWPGGSWSWNSGLIVQPHKWSHVALVASKGQITLYVDGVGVTHQADIQPVLLTELSMGSYKGWTSRNFTGSLDEVSIWKRALSRDEIRLSMHLTLEEDLTDQDLVVYYQFNEPGGPVLDKAGSANGNMYGTSRRINSSAPVGSGASDLIVLHGGIEFNFPGAGVVMTFPTSAQLPEGEVVVTRIDAVPNILPNDHPHSETYWIIDNYGNRSFSSLTGISLSVMLPPSPAVLSDPGLARLYRRRPDTDLNAWEALCPSYEVSGRASATFQFYASCQIGSFGQFVIISDDPDNRIVGSGASGALSPEIRLKEPVMFPNPVASGESVRIRAGSDEQIRLSFYTLAGKLVSDHLLEGADNYLVKPGSQESGVYFYRIQASGSISQGLLVIR